MRVGAMLDSSARKPFVARTLVPSVFNTVAPYIAPHLQPLHDTLLRYDETRYIIEKFDTANRIGSQRYAVVYVAMVWLSIFLLGLGIAMFLRRLGDRSLAPWGVAIVAVLLWPILKCDERSMYFMYDPFTPTIVIWTFYAFYVRYFFAAAVGFVVCMLNRETAALIPAVAAYALIPGEGLRKKLVNLYEMPRLHMSTRGLWIVFGAIVATVVVLVGKYLIVNNIYWGSRGEPLEYKLLVVTLKPMNIVRFFPRVLLVYTFFYVVGIRRWKRLNGLLQGLVLMCVVQLAAGAVVGVIDEFRQYSELYGIGAVLAGVALWPEQQMPSSFAPRARLSCRVAVALFALGTLALVGVSSYRHWTTALFSQATTNRIVLSEHSALSRWKPAGTRWDFSGNYVIESRFPANFVVQSDRHSSYIDIGLDGNDKYLVVLRSNMGVKKHTIEFTGRYGIQNHRLSAPDGILREISVVPIIGDERYSVGYIVIR